MYSVLKKEFSVFFGSAIGYLVAGVFLLFNSLYLWVLPGDMNVLDSGYANLDGFFYIGPYMFVFLCSAITMKMFSDEERNGTMELLLTHPLRSLDIILAKFYASMLLCLAILLPCLLYYLTIYLLASPLGNVDVGGLWGAFIGLVLMVAAFNAIGLFASAINSNQIVAFLLSVAFCFFFVAGFDALAGILPYGAVKRAVLHFGVASHFKTFSKGVLDLRDVLYFASLIGTFVFFTNQTVVSRRQ